MQSVIDRDFYKRIMMMNLLETNNLIKFILIKWIFIKFCLLWIKEQNSSLLIIQYLISLFVLYRSIKYWVDRNEIGDFAYNFLTTFLNGL